ncbi:hypothetical protein CQW23_21740 [Capsicum baccatum]|uniref:Ubiquitin-like protease family profile domain-containing protein n=1 Tax=Capsicum baccatum TaxID=33114 RepID=A0A2G2VYU7_CAPBA|nr:hypothetical protein CQW23_21740 [Capsicum baccatum]
MLDLVAEGLSYLYSSPTKKGKYGSGFLDPKGGLTVDLTDRQVLGGPSSVPLDQDWKNLDAYRDKMSQRTKLLNQHSFEVEYEQNITQQKCDSLDCGVFVAGYTEYLSEEIDVPSVCFEAEYHRMRYASLLQNYGL